MRKKVWDTFAIFDVTIYTALAHTIRMAIQIIDREFDLQYGKKSTVEKQMYFFFK